MATGLLVSPFLRDSPRRCVAHASSGLASRPPPPIGRNGAHHAPPTTLRRLPATVSPCPFARARPPARRGGGPSRGDSQHARPPRKYHPAVPLRARPPIRFRRGPSTPPETRSRPRAPPPLRRPSLWAAPL